MLMVAAEAAALTATTIKLLVEMVVVEMVTRHLMDLVKMDWLVSVVAAVVQVHITQTQVVMVDLDL